MIFDSIGTIGNTIGARYSKVLINILKMELRFN